MDEIFINFRSGVFQFIFCLISWLDTDAIKSASLIDIKSYYTSKLSRKKNLLFIHDFL